jgi:hypothetical protein
MRSFLIELFLEFGGEPENDDGTDNSHYELSYESAWFCYLEESEKESTHKTTYDTQHQVPKAAKAAALHDSASDIASQNAQND